MSLIRRSVDDLTKMEALALCSLLLTLLMVWLGYEGITHDSRIYTLQALKAADPLRYGKDVFLAFGSQDDFTLFSPIYGAAIRLWGVAAANLILYVIGTGLWLAGAGYLARVLKMPLLVTLVAVIVLPMPYGPVKLGPHDLPGSLFHAKEPFLTSRLYAEAFSLFALGLLLRGRLYLALPVALLGFVLHPVMGLAVLVTGYLYQALQSPHWRRWVLVALLGVVGIFVAAWLGVAPANRLFVILDGTWLQAVMDRSVPGLTVWDTGLTRLAFEVLLTATLLFDQRPVLRRLGAAVLLATALGVSAHLIGWDWLHSELFLQAQPWRIAWLTTVVARFALVLLWMAWQRDDSQAAKLQGLAFWLFLATIDLAGLPQVVGGLLGLLTLSLAGRPLSPITCRRLVRAGIVMVAVFFVLGACPDFLAVTAATIVVEPNTTIVDSAIDVIGDGFHFLKLQPSLFIGLVLGIYTLHRRYHTPWLLLGVSVAAWAVAGMGLAVILYGFPAQNFRILADVEAAKVVLPRSGDIFWEGDPLPIWIGLGRTSYLSFDQENVVAFSKEAALEVRRRADHLKVIGTPAENLRFRVVLNVANYPLDRWALARLCSDPAMSYAVLEKQPYRAFAKLPAIGTHHRDWYIYDCADLMPE